MSGASLLEVQSLTTILPAARGQLTALRDVSFSLQEGEILGLVGESGSGKSVTLKSLLQLLPADSQIQGNISWRGTPVSNKGTQSVRSLRGRHIAMIFQEPMSALNPVLTVGCQIDESLRAHTALNRRQRLKRTVELLDMVGIPAASARINDYPHQFSGGMRQRVMIAIALAGEPELLLADEPTTALDVTIQEQILKLLLQLRTELGMSIIFVTHDLAVVAQLCDRVSVMYAGTVVETGPVDTVLHQPLHPYTQGLLASIPQEGTERTPLETIEGTPPSLKGMPEGCPFAPRCTYATGQCHEHRPSLVAASTGHHIACYHPLTSRLTGVCHES